MSRSPVGQHGGVERTMQSAYLKASMNSRMSTHGAHYKSQTSVKKKEIPDSDIQGGKSGDFEESCIVNDDSINDNQENRANLANTVGKVGLSSKMSSKIAISNYDQTSKKSVGQLSQLEVVEPI